MAETLRYTDLITPDDVKLDAINSLGIDVTDATTVSGLDGSYKDAAINTIKDVTEAIESYLDRKLIVRKWDIDIPVWKWEDNKALDDMQHYPRHWPVVQVVTSGVSISNDGVRLLSNTTQDEVEFYAGYRRREQDLTALQNDLASLTSLPAELPYDIRRVAFRLVMYELSMAQQNIYALSSVTKTAGGATAEITKARSDVYGEELSKLHSHRRVA